MIIGLYREEIRENRKKERKKKKPYWAADDWTRGYFRCSWGTHGRLRSSILAGILLGAAEIKHVVSKQR